MGFAFPASLGVSRARPDKEVWCVAGEGGFVMTMQELATAVHENLDVKIIILNNYCLGMVRQFQDDYYEGVRSAIDLHGAPDFVKLADAYGIPAWRTTTVHAVVTTEQQLFARGQTLPDAGSALSSWLPPGPAAVADYPTVLLSGSWLSQEQVTAASEFARFMHKPDQLAELAKAGFRAEGNKSPKSDVTSFPALPSTLSVGDDGTRAALANVVSAPASAPAAIIMLEQSMITAEGDKTRLGNVVSALEDRIKSLSPSAVIGLWTFDGKEGRSEVSAGPLTDQVDGRPRSEALTAALDRQHASSGGAVSFTTLRLIYQKALANFHAGQTDFSLRDHGRSPHRSESRRRGPATIHQAERRPGQACRGQRDRLRVRLRPGDLGGCREALRRQLPEPRYLGIAGPGHRGRQVPELTKLDAGCIGRM